MTDDGTGKRVCRRSDSQSDIPCCLEFEENPVNEVQCEKTTIDPVPLKNLGNTCYLNSAVQALIPLEDLFQLLESSINYLLENGKLVRKNFPILSCLYHLLEIYDDERVRKSEEPSLQPKIVKRLEKLKESVGNVREDFKSSRQQDVAEFLQIILTQIFEELKSKGISDETNPVTHFITGLVEVPRCLLCKSVTTRPSILCSTLFVNIPFFSNQEDDLTDKKFSVQELLELHFGNLERSDQDCSQEHCNGKAVEVTTFVKKLPVFLLLYLGRYKIAEGNYVKNETCIEVEPEIRLPFETKEEDAVKRMSVCTPDKPCVKTLSTLPRQSNSLSETTNLLLTNTATPDMHQLTEVSEDHVQKFETTDPEDLELLRSYMTSSSISTENKENLTERPKLRRLDLSEGVTYDIQSVICHRGPSLNTGHYYSFIKNPVPPFDWYSCDDENILKVDFKQLNQTKHKRRVYCLFFKKRNI